MTKFGPLHVHGSVHYFLFFKKNVVVGTGLRERLKFELGVEEGDLVCFLVGNRKLAFLLSGFCKMLHQHVGLDTMLLYFSHLFFKITSS